MVKLLSLLLGYIISAVTIAVFTTIRGEEYSHAVNYQIGLVSVILTVVGALLVINALSGYYYVVNTLLGCNSYYSDDEDRVAGAYKAGTGKLLAASLLVPLLALAASALIAVRHGGDWEYPVDNSDGYAYWFITNIAITSIALISIIWSRIATSDKLNIAYAVLSKNVIGDSHDDDERDIEVLRYRLRELQRKKLDEEHKLQKVQQKITTESPKRRWLFGK